MLGVLSLILWALFIVVTAEICAVPAARRQQWRGRNAVADGAGHAGAWAGGRLPLMVLGVIGASMFYRRLHDHPGDLGAVGGRKASSWRRLRFEPYVVPVTVVDSRRAVLGAVGWHRHGRVAVRAGDDRCGSWRSPLMGASHIVDDPTVLAAINPYYAVQFMLTHG